MADGNLGRSQMGNGGLLKPVTSSALKKSTLVYILNQQLIHRSIITMYRSTNVLTLYCVYGTFPDLPTLETSNGSSFLNMHRIGLILVPFNAELNFTHFEPKHCIPLTKAKTGL